MTEETTLKVKWGGQSLTGARKQWSPDMPSVPACGDYHEITVLSLFGHSDNNNISQLWENQTDIQCNPRRWHIWKFNVTFSSLRMFTSSSRSKTPLKPLPYKQEDIFWKQASTYDWSTPLPPSRGGTGSLFLIFPCKDNFCPCYPCQRSKILVILARASGRGQKSWPGWYFGTFCLWK